MEFNKFSFMSHEVLWVLQTQLKLKKLTKITKYLECKKDLTYSTIKNTLNIAGVDKEDAISILKKINEANHPKNIMGRYTIEALIERPFCHPALLAFQYLGNPNILKKPRVAIIGSRHPTYYGREQAQKFAKYLAQEGCTIISGGAIGIDAIANATAIENGFSCAIIGSGIKNLYPSSNLWLFQNMINSKNGLILSEFNSFETPQKWHFPRRNLSIASIADFVLVIEATKTSGSLITANAALDLGIDVGALPGNIENLNSTGTNALIQNGAFCIQTPQDVLERILFIHNLQNNNKNVMGYSGCLIAKG